MSESDAEDILKGVYGTAPIAEEKKGVHQFLHNVATAKDTTKTGFLSTEEVGTPRLPLRSLKELSLFCREVANKVYAADYFGKKAEILTATSLSKEGFLTKLAVIIKRETSNVLKTPMKENRSWFKKKNRDSEGGLQ